MSLCKFIEETLQRYVNKYKEGIFVIVQRCPDRFWSVLFKQIFDLSSDVINIRLAGEEGADLGGLLCEFLTLAMKRFSDAPGLFIVSESSEYFNEVPHSIIKNHYFMLGQLTGLSILKIGVDPQCLNPTVVQAFYDLILLEVKYAALDACISNIDNKDYSDLYDMNITPCKDINESKRVFTIIVCHFNKLQCNRSVQNWIG